MHLALSRARWQVLRRPNELDFPVRVDHRREARRRPPEEAGAVAPWRMVRRVLHNAPVVFGDEASVLFHMSPLSLSSVAGVVKHVNYIDVRGRLN